jgi:5'-3' exonuclease
MKVRTLLVDSSYLLKRSINGAKNTHTSKFGHIGGLYQFFTTTRMLIKDHKINKVILIWDGENGGIDRYHIDPAYKANRKNKSWHQKIEMTDAEIKREQEKDESILKQRKRIQAYAEELFLRQIEIDNIEADDLIAQYCFDHNNMEEIYIFTNDRDFSQLLNLNITIIFGNIEQPITKTNYFYHFNHHFTNALLMKIICGDDADNIKGIKGMGEDTLLKYIPDLAFKHFTVREICKIADDLNKERIANKQKPLKLFENLINGIDRLVTNHKLVNLRQPFLNDEAREALLQLEIPLDPTDRGSKNLMKMMLEDEFLTVYGSTFVNYVEPFYVVIMNEKQLLTEYNKNIKRNL